MKSWFSKKDRLLAGTIMAGAAVAGFAGPAMAQDSGDEEIVVTGSRIPQPNLTSISPVTQVGQEDISGRGVTRIEDALNVLPQVLASQSSGYANGATGTATADLRGLGNIRTLTIMNGRRLPGGDPSVGQAAPDLNFIPSALVERVEVLTGGASAVYGADAVAGVVNFIMMDDFEGVRIDGQTSFYQHHNDSRIGAIVAAREATNPRFYRVPEENVIDGETWDFSAIFGANTDDGRGNVTVYANYRNVAALLQGERDYSACTLGPNAGGDFTACLGSSNSFPLVFTPLEQTGANLLGATQIIDNVTGLPRNFSGSLDQFNFGAVNHYQRPDTRYSLGGMAHYEVNPHVDLYAEVGFMDDRSNAQIAPSAIFAFSGYGANLGAYVINCDNPHLVNAGLVSTVCGADADTVTAGVQENCPDTDLITAGNQALCLVDFRYRNVNGGNRQSDLRHQAYRTVLGARGEITEGWNYDMYGLYGSTSYTQIYRNEVSLRAVSAGLVVDDLGGGNYVCRVNNDADPNNDVPGCVPLNVFNQNGLNAAETASITATGFQTGELTTQVFSAAITGDLGTIGMTSPWAEDGIAVAFGTEYRRETSRLETDVLFCPTTAPGAVSDLLGQGGTTCPVAGDYDVFELFGEARIPIVQSQPFFEELSMELAYRYSDYSTGVQTDTYKVGLNWAPTEDVRFRGAYQRAVRAPNITELFAPQAVGLDGSADPCAGPTTQANFPTQAQCAFSGVTVGQYGTIASSPAGQYNGLLGGNPTLNPEIADTVTLGIVFTPTFLEGFSVSVDWYDIQIEQVISNIGADFILTNCISTGNPLLCGLVNRNPNGTLWGAPTGFITDTQVNAGGLSTTGVDVSASYRFDAGGIGGFGLNFNGNWMSEYINEPVVGLGTYDCVGLYGPVCGRPRPEWRHVFGVTWETPMTGLEITGTWRHMGETLLDQTSSNPLLAFDGVVELSDRLHEAQNYFDLGVSWDVWENVTFRAGVNNVLDRDPPLTSNANTNSNCPTGACSGNSWPGVYDVLGRYFFVGVTADFYVLQVR